mgnify:FL=1
MSNKFGIYIHIPFCTTICPFCNFNVYKAQTEDYNDLVALLLSELQENYKMFSKKKLVSIHFGGGTPSLLSPKLINKILEQINKLFFISPQCEIAIEINPYDSEVDNPKNLYEVGINRLSIGIQSFNDNKLKLLGRKSTKQSNIDFINKISNCGITNFNLDFIFGVNQESLDEWEDELNYLEEIDIKHVSTYCLTIEESTPFWKLHERGEIIKVSEDIFLDMASLTKRKLNNLGLKQYEVSNFSKPSYESIHNLLYWNCDSYLGVGPGAHSSLIDLEQGKYCRWENKKTIYDYGSSEGIKYDLGLEQYIKDAFMMGLRLKKGISLSYLKSILPFELNELKIGKLIEENVVISGQNIISLTEKGFNISDNAIYELIESIEFKYD